jgi:hypothetical protein
MSHTISPNFGLVVPTPGSGEPINVTDVAGNWTAVDTLARAIICTSGTRPAPPFAGQCIFETDTGLIRIRNTANTLWVTVGGLVKTFTSGTRPATPDPGQLHWESDTNALVVRSATGSWQYPGIPIVPTTATISSPLTDQIVYDQSVPGFRKRAGASWDLFDGNCLHKYKAATESVTSSTTLQNDDVFAFASLPINSAWELESFLPFDGAADPAGGLKMSFTGPAGASMYFVTYGANTGALSSYDVVVQGVGAAGRVMGTNGGTIMSCRLSGSVVIGSTAGTLQFQWAQGTSNATPTRILGSAWMKLTRIG